MRFPGLAVRRATPFVALALCGLIIAGYFYLRQRRSMEEARARAAAPVQPADARVIFRPVVRKDTATRSGDLYMVARDPPSQEFLRDAAFVLAYYRLEFEWKDGALMVSATSWKNQELMANITTKARDAAWLATKRSGQP
jgi:hypothetical protein